MGVNKCPACISGPPQILSLTLSAFSFLLQRENKKPKALKIFGVDSRMVGLEIVPAGRATNPKQG